MVESAASEVGSKDTDKTAGTVEAASGIKNANVTG